MKKSARIIMAVSLTVTGLTTVGVSAYYLIEYFKPSEVSTSVFNDVAMNLELSQDSFDVDTLDKYKQNTASVLVRSSPTQGSMGTIWNYGYKASVLGGARHYFATNIHVISSVVTASNDEIGFRVPPNAFVYKTLNNTNGIQMLDVKIEKINAYKSFNDVGAPTADITDDSENKDYITYGWYSDFVILSTSTQIFGGENSPFNFLDDPEEFRWLKNQVSLNINNLSFYICGFPASVYEQTPWPESATWTAVKYQWDTKTSYRGGNPGFSSSGTLFDDYLRDGNPDSGEVIAGSLYKNYAHQLILPKLNMRGGSSGSLVTAKYEDPITAENTWLAVGIYWGGYSAGTNEDIFLGGVDLFYTPWFDYLKYTEGNKTILQISLAYNNLYTIK